MGGWQVIANFKSRRLFTLVASSQAAVGEVLALGDGLAQGKAPAVNDGLTLLEAIVLARELQGERHLPLLMQIHILLLCVSTQPDGYAKLQ